MKYDKLVLKFENLSFKCFSEFMQHPYYLLLAKMWEYAIKTHCILHCDTKKYNPKSEKVGTVWKTQIKKESSDF